MSIDIVRTLPEEKWRAFVWEHPDGNIFHTPEMFRVFGHTKGDQPELWAATEDGRVLALLLPVRITLKDGLLRHFTTRAVVYGSVLCTSSAIGCGALDLLLSTYKHEVHGTSLYTELRNLCNLDPVQPILRKHGFLYENHLNFLLNLRRPPETIFQSIGHRTRKNIRHGLKQGKVVVEEVKTREQVVACHDLLRQTYRAAHVPLADCSLFEAAFDLLGPKEMVRFTLARVGDRPVATSVELLYRDIIYGWYGGMDRAFGSYVPNELLLWHILQWGAENGYRLYDFGGAGKPDEKYGVRDFKAKFGSELVSFGRNICVHAPASLRLSKLAYGIYRSAAWAWR